MNIKRIRRLAMGASVAQLVAAGIPRRTVYRLRAGEPASLATLQKLDEWAKGRRLPRAALGEDAAGEGL